jgi:hypothetical protein
MFTVKYKANGFVERYKGSIGYGFTQTYCMDYEEMFIPVTKMNSIWFLLSLAANLDWPLHQFDVKIAFIRGDLQEGAYMEVPPDLEFPSANSKVCKLKKAL